MSNFISTIDTYIFTHTVCIDTLLQQLKIINKILQLKKKNFVISEIQIKNNTIFSNVQPPNLHYKIYFYLCRAVYAYNLAIDDKRTCKDTKIKMF